MTSFFLLLTIPWLSETFLHSVYILLENTQNYITFTPSLAFFLLAQQSPVGQGLLIHEVFNHTQQRTTVGRTPLDGWSARPRDLYLTTHNIHNRDIHAPGGIRTHNLSRRAAADPRLRPSGNWDRYYEDCILLKFVLFLSFHYYYYLVTEVDSEPCFKEEARFKWVTILII